MVFCPFWQEEIELIDRLTTKLLLFLTSYGIKGCRQNIQCFGMEYSDIFKEGENVA